MDQIWPYMAIYGHIGPIWPPHARRVRMMVGRIKIYTTAAKKKLKHQISLPNHACFGQGHCKKNNGPIICVASVRHNCWEFVSPLHPSVNTWICTITHMSMQPCLHLRITIPVLPKPFTCKAKIILDTIASDCKELVDNAVPWQCCLGRPKAYIWKSWFKTRLAIPTWR